MMKKLLICLLALLLPAMALAQAELGERGVGFYFDTVVTLTLYDAPEGLMDEVWDACGRYESLLSRTREGSDVWRINHADGAQTRVDPETADILREALTVNQRSGGAFCVTIAPLTEQWDFSHGTNRMPTEAERLAALPLVDDNKLLVEDNTVTLPAGMEIDLGGIAKGYIADQIAAMVRGRVSGAILNFGGNTYVLGTKPDGSAFRVGVQDPWGSTGTPLLVITLTDLSLVTSGTYERQFEVDGITYHHILDPKTGLPAETNLVSATIFSVSSMEADAYATACIVLGQERAMALLEENGLTGILIDTEGNVTTTPDFPWTVLSAR